MKLENNLGTDAIRPLVLRIAIPSMLAQFVSVLYSIVDRIYISNIPLVGETALAGVGGCGPVGTLIGAFGEHRLWAGGHHDQRLCIADWRGRCSAHEHPHGGG